MAKTRSGSMTSPLALGMLRRPSHKLRNKQGRPMVLD